jgi:hypothetical protein
MDFGEVFTRAWKIIWKFKILWIFGILSSCGQGGGGSGGGGNTGFQFSNGDANIPPGMRDFFNRAEDFFVNIQAWEIAALVVGLLLFILIMILITSAINTVGGIGLIQGTLKAEDGAEKMTFGELFRDGQTFFWRVFGLNILIGLVMSVGVIIFVLPFVGIGIVTAGIGFLCFIPFLCLLIPAIWLVSVLFEQMNIAIVVEDLKIKDALIRGWDVFKENLGNILVMGLILGLGSTIISIFFAVPLIMVTIPAVIGIAGGSIWGSGVMLGSGLVVAALGFLILMPVIIVLGGILQAYVKTAWTLTYLRLTMTTDVSMDTINLSPEDD